LPSLRLRDRDAITTKEGIIFRVFGYSHPSNAYVCDAEYAPAEIFRSSNPKAFRNNRDRVFYKFYEDEGWKFIQNNFPQYLILHEMLQKKVIGVNLHDIQQAKKPETELQKLIGTEPQGELVGSMRKVLDFVTEHSGLHIESFGVFGSMLHGFHHPKLSDIDLIIYGRENTARLCETLHELYGNGSSPLRNEFETDEALRGKLWKFQNLTPEEFLWHQRRKLIYAVFRDEKSGRTIKTEFEPVKDWKEIQNGHDKNTRIVQKGWVKMHARIARDDDAPFIPSVYDIEPLEILDGPKESSEAKRIVSYMEEYRMQAHKDEAVYVAGNLEKVTTSRGNFYQIALTYCPRYYEQTLKVETCT
jgi:predicted nucleotidyltransferase